MPRLLKKILTMRESSQIKKKKTQRDTLEDETDEIFAKLREKHSDTPSPKLRLWAKVIHSGRYDDYDTPRDVPLITGAPAPLKPRKNNVATALTGAASVIVQALSSSPRRGSRDENDEGASAMISPLKMTRIRQNCLDDLKLKELYSYSR